MSCKNYGLLSQKFAGLLASSSPPPPSSHRPTCVTLTRPSLNAPQPVSHRPAHLKVRCAFHITPPVASLSLSSMPLSMSCSRGCRGDICPAVPACTALARDLGLTTALITTFDPHRAHVPASQILAITTTAAIIPSLNPPVAQPARCSPHPDLRPSSQSLCHPLLRPLPRATSPRPAPYTPRSLDTAAIAHNFAHQPRRHRLRQLRTKQLACSITTTTPPPSSRPCARLPI
ncbi:hypothetical protein C8R45DRAFT_1114457 [Mycena sanguinolenta]|nr:hypothetical protein C8R45DRAFT_1114457 [Mycena sanguinolenta]